MISSPKAKFPSHHAPPARQIYSTAASRERVPSAAPTSRDLAPHPQVLGARPPPGPARHTPCHGHPHGGVQPPTFRPSEPTFPRSRSGGTSSASTGPDTPHPAPHRRSSAPEDPAVREATEMDRAAPRPPGNSVNFQGGAVRRGGGPPRWRARGGGPRRSHPPPTAPCRCRARSPRARPGAPRPHRAPPRPSVFPRAPPPRAQPRPGARSPAGAPPRPHRPPPHPAHPHLSAVRPPSQPPPHPRSPRPLTGSPLQPAGAHKPQPRPGPPQHSAPPGAASFSPGLAGTSAHGSPHRGYF